jgi:hypothetical protein
VVRVHKPWLSIDGVPGKFAEYRQLRRPLGFIAFGYRRKRFVMPFEQWPAHFARAATVAIERSISGL